MNISIIIPNYNGEQLLKKNLPKVIEAADFYSKETKQTVEIIIVDDCSDDNSIESIKSYVSSIKYKNIAFIILQNKTNLGFASAVNRGVKEAQGEIVVLLNTDVVPEKEFLIPLIEHFKEGEVFAVGCLDKSVENDKIVLRGRGVGKWQRGFLVHCRGEINRRDTLWVNGGSGAFRKSIWEKLGGFNKIYSPFYWEDIDLSYRAQKSGYKVIFEPNSIVVHEHEKGAIKSRYSPFQIKTIAYRNQFIFVWHNLTDLRLQFFHFFWLPYHFVKALLDQDWSFFIGFFKAFILLPKIMQSSFKAQDYFVKKDKEVIEG